MTEIAGKENEETEEDRLQGEVLITRLDFAHAIMADHYTTINDIECKKLVDSLFEAEEKYQHAHNAMIEFYNDEQLKDMPSYGTA